MSLNIDQQILSLDYITVMIGRQPVSVVDFTKKSIVVETPPLNAGTYNVVINNRDSDRTGLSVEVTVVDISVNRVILEMFQSYLFKDKDSVIYTHMTVNLEIALFLRFI